MEPEELPVKMINVTPTQYRNIPNESYEFDRSEADFNKPTELKPEIMPPRQSSTERKMAKLGKYHLIVYICLEKFMLEKSNAFIVGLR